jgi:hypothetical protein
VRVVEAVQAGQTCWQLLPGCNSNAYRPSSQSIRGRAKSEARRARQQHTETGCFVLLCREGVLAFQTAVAVCAFGLSFLCRMVHGMRGSTGRRSSNNRTTATAAAKCCLSNPSNSAAQQHQRLHGRFGGWCWCAPCTSSWPAVAAPAEAAAAVDLSGGELTGPGSRHRCDQALSCWHLFLYVSLHPDHLLMTAQTARSTWNSLGPPVLTHRLLYAVLPSSYRRSTSSASSQGVRPFRVRTPHPDLVPKLQ